MSSILSNSTKSTASWKTWKRRPQQGHAKVERPVTPAAGFISEDVERRYLETSNIWTPIYLTHIQKTPKDSASTSENSKDLQTSRRKVAGLAWAVEHLHRKLARFSQGSWGFPFSSWNQWSQWRNLTWISGSHMFFSAWKTGWFEMGIHRKSHGISWLKCEINRIQWDLVGTTYTGRKYGILGISHILVKIWYPIEKWCYLGDSLWKMMVTMGVFLMGYQVKSHVTKVTKGNQTWQLRIPQQNAAVE